MGNIDRDRLKIRSMLSLSAPADALYAYYAFYHDPGRTELHIHQDDAEAADGFLAVCQTAQRLFQPTVVLRTTKVDVATKLMKRAMERGRPYHLVTTPDLREAVLAVTEMTDPVLSRIYEIDLSRFEYQVNVMVVAEEGVENRPRFLVRAGEEIVAEAGVTWLSPQFAAVHAEATPAAQRRGLGESVLTACTRWVLRSGRRPLIMVGMTDEQTTTLVETAGYVDSGARELAGDVTCCF